MTLDWDPKTEIVTLSPTQPLLIISGGEPPSLAILWPFLQLFLVSALEDLGASSVPMTRLSICTEPALLLGQDLAAGRMFLGAPDA